MQAKLYFRRINGVENLLPSLTFSELLLHFLICLRHAYTHEWNTYRHTQCRHKHCIQNKHSMGKWKPSSWLVLTWTRPHSFLHAHTHMYTNIFLSPLGKPLSFFSLHSVQITSRWDKSIMFPENLFPPLCFTLLAPCSPSLFPPTPFSCALCPKGHSYFIRGGSGRPRG